MITTRELARLAGVSQSTVSRSLNNHPAIPVKTRERIAELAREHGYEPPRHHQEANLATRKKGYSRPHDRDTIHEPLS